MKSTFVLLSVMLLFAQPTNAATAQPNVVVILTDDQGWGDLSVHGNSNLSTPNVDSLARNGVLLDRFFVCPVCSPTRAEFLTGRYHPRGGVHDVSRGGERLNLDEKTIGDTFKAAGYMTGAFGKWHNGTQWPYHPNARGFREYYGFTSGHWGSYFDPPLDHNGQPVQGKGFIIDDLTDHAIQFMEQNKNRPFFCYVPYNTPHSPMQVPERFYEKFAKVELKLRSRDPKLEDVDFTRAALAMCENIDWNVGRILKRLDALNLAQNTIVVYFCDNGPNSWRWNGNMKGRKGSTDEGGVRSPCLVRWPGHIPAGRRIPQIAGAIDLLPTLASLAGIPIASRKPLDGVDLTPLLMGTAKDWPDRSIFSHWGGRVSVRTQRYRLDNTRKLFDMEADPGQDRDITKEQPEIAARLSKAVAAWREEMLPGLKKDDRPFPVGHPECPLTQLPARDGVAHGGVQRSANAPNCSYFQNWTRLNDRIAWDVEVAAAGRYEAVIYYTCPQADVGSVVELSLNGSRIEGVVSEANDPPLRGAENDRVPRKGESYMKDFRPLRLGVIALKPGRGELTLRAVKIPGKQVMDVRAVHLLRAQQGEGSVLIDRMRRRRSDRVTLVYAPESENVARDVLRYADRCNEQLAEWFQPAALVSQKVHWLAKRDWRNKPETYGFPYAEGADAYLPASDVDLPTQLTYIADSMAILDGGPAIERMARLLQLSRRAGSSEVYKQLTQSPDFFFAYTAYFILPHELTHGFCNHLQYPQRPRWWYEGAAQWAAYKMQSQLRSQREADMIDQYYQLLWERATALKVSNFAQADELGAEGLDTPNYAWYHAGLLRMFRQLEEMRGGELLPELLPVIGRRYRDERIVPQAQMMETFSAVVGRDLQSWFREKWNLGG